MTLLGLVGGALLGLLGGFGGAFLGAACGALFDLYRASRRRTQVATLEARLTRLEGEVQALQRALREPGAAANVPNGAGEVLATTADVSESARSVEDLQLEESQPFVLPVPDELPTLPLTDQPTACDSH